MPDSFPFPSVVRPYPEQVTWHKAPAWAAKDRNCVSLVCVASVEEGWVEELGRSVDTQWWQSIKCAERMMNNLADSQGSMELVAVTALSEGAIMCSLISSHLQPPILTAVAPPYF